MAFEDQAQQPGCRLPVAQAKQAQCGAIVGCRDEQSYPAEHGVLDANGFTLCNLPSSAVRMVQLLCIGSKI